MAQASNRAAPRQQLAMLVAGGLLAACAAQPSVRPVVLDPALIQPTVPAAPETAPAPSATLDAPNVARNPAEVPAPLGRSEPGTVDVTLTVQELTAEMTDGTSYDFWTFDGTVPGPLIRVMEGDTVNLTLVNDTSSQLPHNIDLHAVTGPGGGAAVTNVRPGEEATLTFKALQAGAYIYHCAFPPPMHHIAQGMYGVIVVEPPGGLPPVDREFYVVQGDWYTSGPLGAPGHQAFDNQKALAEAPEYITFNGHAAALTNLFPLQANVGETVRIFFGNGGPNLMASFHIIGEIFDRVYAGSPETFVANEETVAVPPGSGAIFELTLEVPGEYLLVDHALFRANKGAAGLLVVAGRHDPAIYAPVPTANAEGYGAEAPPGDQP